VQPEAKRPNFLVALANYVFRLLQWTVGVRINRKNLNTRNSFDAVMIILATFFLFPIYSGYIDVFAQAVDGDFINKYAVEGFRFSFIVSSIWLVLISLFSEVKFPILRFLTLVIPGMVLGVVLTYLMGLLVSYTQGLWKIDEITLFIMTIYPVIFSFFVRFKINQRMKYKPEVPKLTELQRSVYLE